MEIVITRDPPYKLAPWNRYKEFFEKGKEISYLAEAMMLLAARLDNYERLIKPALSRGALIISDRYIDSWFAYQSIRLSDYFNKNSAIALEFLLKLNQELIQKGFLIMPDLTILISDNPEITIQRKNQEKEVSKYDELDIQRCVHEQYKVLARMFPTRILLINVEHKNIHEGYKVVKAIVQSWLNALQKDEHLFLSKRVRVGQQIMALRQLSWTLGKFDDYPLVVVSGDKGTIKSLKDEQKKVLVEWDKDEFKNLEKALSLESEERFSCVILH